MGQLKYLVIHTTDTPFDCEVTPDDITMWHLGPIKLTSGKYRFLGKDYTKMQLASQKLTLPSGKVITADRISGRGWSKTGYADMIQRTGKLINMNPYNWDAQIDPWEVTNGVANKNSISRHVVLAGGWSKNGIRNGMKTPGKYFKIEDLYTKEQIETLVEYVKEQVKAVPGLIVCGHNDLAAKSCPNFKVSEFVKDYGIECKTI